MQLVAGLLIIPTAGAAPSARRRPLPAETPTSAAGRAGLPAEKKVCIPARHRVDTPPRPLPPPRQVDDAESQPQSCTSYELRSTDRRGGDAATLRWERVRSWRATDERREIVLICDAPPETLTLQAASHEEFDAWRREVIGLIWRY